MERRSPKSPFSKSPIPKSPVLYEKYKSRCAYGFINFFHFRRSNSKKLISNRRHLSRDAIGKIFPFFKVAGWVCKTVVVQVLILK
uniref:Uncharacterized protein n=1 Tax=Rhizophora mucronata TaxID=61149 RepID=A0A2P2JTH7_RHIMU